MPREKLALLSLAVVWLGSLVGCGGDSGGSGSGSVGNFTLSASSGVTVAQKGQSTTVITITPLNGFDGAVTLSTSQLPSGLTAAFNPASATTSSTLTFNASASATTGVTTVTVTGMAGASTSSTTLTLTVIKAGQVDHVVIIFQENRSVDNLFQGLCTAKGSPGCDPTGADPSKYDIASQGVISSGQTIPLTPVTLVVPYDLGHSHISFLDACDYNPSTNTCAMDGANKIPCDGSQCPANASYQYVQSSDVQPYLTMAQTYAFGDHMFQSNEGPSFPAHQYILSGTSRIAATSSTTIADNPTVTPQLNGSLDAGCLAPPGSYVNAIDIDEASPLTKLTIVDYPLCFEHPTLTDLLDNAALSWKYYAAMPGSIWTAPDAIEHMCQPYSADGKNDDTVCNGPDWTNANPNVVIEGSGAQIITDITNGQLATVNWVIPTGANSDHADNSVDNGPSWVSSIVNAVGNRQYWADTVIIVTWDDWGGWYDHVPPPLIRDSYEYGLRVPMIVVSPYAKPAYISHQVNDFGSVLKFVEEIFALPTIDNSNPSTPYADSYALGDLSDFFDFNQTPQPFTPIDAPLKADYFLNDKSPPTPPDND